ncbi:MAG: hypothetical protein V3S89_15965 [Desulfobacterales bacterium]
MAKELNIPKDLRGTFNRLTRRIPAKLRVSEDVRKTTLTFLKLGGEKLTKASIETLRVPFVEKFILKKMQLKDDDLLETPVAQAAPAPATGENTTKTPETKPPIVP